MPPCWEWTVERTAGKDDARTEGGWSWSTDRRRFWLLQTLEHSSEADASSWMGVIPIATQGSNLNKGEFQDFLSLSDTWCQSRICHPSILHAMNCMRAGFIGICDTTTSGMQASDRSMQGRWMWTPPTTDPQERNLQRDSYHWRWRASGFWKTFVWAILTVMWQPERRI